MKPLGSQPKMRMQEERIAEERRTSITPSSNVIPTHIYLLCLRKMMTHLEKVTSALYFNGSTNKMSKHSEQTKVRTEHVLRAKYQPAARCIGLPIHGTALADCIVLCRKADAVAGVVHLRNSSPRNCEFRRGHRFYEALGQVHIELFWCVAWRDHLHWT